MERQRQLICWGVSFCENVIKIKKEDCAYHIREVTKMVQAIHFKGWWAVYQNYTGDIKCKIFYYKHI